MADDNWIRSSPGVDFDDSKATENAISAIDQEVEKAKLEFTEKMAYFEQTKQELLCIGNDGANNE